MINPPMDTEYCSTIKHIPEAEKFYQEYIKPRRPVVLRGATANVLENQNVRRQLLPETLLTLVSNRPVQVNTKSGESFSPQRGSKSVEVAFHSVCDQWIRGSDSVYMTTQTLPLDDEARPAVYNWLTKELLDQAILPLRPKLFGNLVPMNVANLWMGHSTATRSSGLHHDYHDNLYCLIQGRKRIRLAPPQAVYRMEMVGTVQTVHDNGRIVYKGQGTVRPDGALESVQAIMTLERVKAEIEGQLDDTKTVSAKEREKLEERLERVEDQLLEAEMDGDSDHSDDSEDSGLLFGKQQEPKVQQTLTSNESDSYDDKEPAVKRAKTCDLQEDFDVPPNFVKDSKHVPFQEIELDPGDVVYLPCGYFHEVISFGGTHVAVNYWVHPPDTIGTFDEPYRSKFWQYDWNNRGI